MKETVTPQPQGLQDIVYYGSEAEQEMVRTAFEALLHDYQMSNHRRKDEIIIKAFNLANKAHAGVRRRSGEPYIMHPIAVAYIVSHEMGLGSTSIASALLHDVIEDTEYTEENIRDMFGDKIAQIVQGLTKISVEMFKDQEDVSAQAENFRKLILTMNDDIRVVLIKIADRLHNMRTLESMPTHKQLKITGETLYVYAPIAHRLGLFTIKTELEELCFHIEHPAEYNEIKNKIEASEEQRTLLFEHFAAPLREVFARKKLNYEMKARVKSCYSIWRKMQEKKIPFEEVYDLYAVRIIFESQEGIPDKKVCWDIYSEITDLYRNKTDRIRDWVSSPKTNGYQALHLTVMGPDGEWIEIQIRSRRMDDIAERGFAAHWKYKSENVEEDSELDRWIETIREILENPTPDSMDFLDTIKLNLYSDEISVFTPKGKVFTLPKGATGLDFAYALHGELGNKCLGIKINHHLFPLSHTLRNGDQVEVITSPTQEPHPEWLKYVVTGKARMKINAALRKADREKTALGEKMVTELLEAEGQTITPLLLDKIASYYNFHKREDFFLAVGNRSIELPESFRKVFQGADGNFFSRLFRPSKKNRELTAATIEEAQSPDKPNTKKPYLLEQHLLTPNYTIAPCCSPILGDDTVGFVTDNGTIMVHKRNCPEAMRLKSSKGNQLIETVWGDHPHSLFEATLAIKGMDSIGILNAIIQDISEDFYRSITSINLSAQGGVFGGEIKVMVHDVEDVRRIIEGLKQKDTIASVTRV